MTWERRDKAAARARMSFLDIWVFAEEYKLFTFKFTLQQKSLWITKMDTGMGVRIAQKSLFFYTGIASEHVLCVTHLYDII
jgi:hypothetical protein